MATPTPLREEIELIRTEQNIPEEHFRPLSSPHWEDIQSNLFQTFDFDNLDSDPGTYSVWVADSYPFDKLSELVDLAEVVWLFVNENVNGETKFWFYEGYITAIVNVLNESCLVSKVFVASKEYDWLLCINQHDYLIAKGKIMVGKLKELEKKI